MSDNDLLKLFELKDDEMVRWGDLRVLVEEARKEWVKEVRKKLEEMKWKDDDDGGSMTANMGYNQALSDIITTLKGMKE